MCLWSFTHLSKHIAASEKIQRNVSMMLVSMEIFLNAEQLNRPFQLGEGANKACNRLGYEKIRQKPQGSICSWSVGKLGEIKWEKEMVVWNKNRNRVFFCGWSPFDPLADPCLNFCNPIVLGSAFPEIWVFSSSVIESRKGWKKPQDLLIHSFPLIQDWVDLGISSSLSHFSIYLQCKCLCYIPRCPSWSVTYLFQGIKIRSSSCRLN